MIAAVLAPGAVGVLIRRNVLVMFMCIELMLNAVNLTLVTFSRIVGNLQGQVIAFFVMARVAGDAPGDTRGRVHCCQGRCRDNSRPRGASGLVSSATTWTWFSSSTAASKLAASRFHFHN